MSRHSFRGRHAAWLALVIVGLPSYGQSAARATLIHQYRLDNSLADDFAGPDLTPLGGTVGPTSYSFGANQGLSLSGALPSGDNYTVETQFSFETLSGYRRILDFKNLSTDGGLYNLATAVNFYPIVTGPASAFAENIPARVVVTRDAATNLITAYVNGVQQISFTDSGGAAIFDGPGGIMHFFQDDFAVGGEASAGVVDYIRIYDAPLTAGDVAALTDPTVPEPTALTLALAAGGATYWLRRRSRTRATR